MIGYSQRLENLISQYDEDSQIIKADRLIMEHYPKVFLLSAASSFEQGIKRQLSRYYSHNLATLSPCLQQIANRQTNKPFQDKLFAKLKAYSNTSSGLETLDAQDFFNCFSNENLEQVVMRFFQNILAQSKNNLMSTIDSYKRLLSATPDDSLITLKLKNEEIFDIWKSTTYDSSKESYLALKLRRNKIAHEYFAVSDTFNDIRKFYYQSFFFVLALEQGILSLSGGHSEQV